LITRRAPSPRISKNSEGRRSIGQSAFFEFLRVSYGRCDLVLANNPDTVTLQQRRRHASARHKALAKRAVMICSFQQDGLRDLRMATRIPAPWAKAKASRASGDESLGNVVAYRSRLPNRRSPGRRRPAESPRADGAQKVHRPLRTRRNCAAPPRDQVFQNQPCLHDPCASRHTGPCGRASRR